MINTLLVNVLNSYLGELVENLDVDNIGEGAIKGDILLLDLKIRPDALVRGSCSFRTGVSPSAGMVSCFQPLNYWRTDKIQPIQFHYTLQSTHTYSFIITSVGYTLDSCIKVPLYRRGCARYKRARTIVQWQSFIEYDIVLSTHKARQKMSKHKQGPSIRFTNIFFEKVSLRLTRRRIWWHVYFLFGENLLQPRHAQKTDVRVCVCLCNFVCV